MKKIIGLIILMLLPATSFAAFGTDTPAANDPWGDGSSIGVGLAIKKGLSVSAWNSAGRNDAKTSGDYILWATPQGDGTYMVRYDLIPGADYNFVWMSTAATSVAQYFNKSNTDVVAEPVPNGESGQITGDQAYFATKSTINATASGQLLATSLCTYGNIAGDGRRKIRLSRINEEGVTSGTTIYVYTNFGSHETGANISDILVDSGAITLVWYGSIGWWNRGAPSYNTAGGTMRAYVSTNSYAGPYSPLTGWLTYSTTFFTHGVGGSGGTLTNGLTYYYIFVASDAYKGVTRQIVLRSTGPTVDTSTTTKTEFANYVRDDPSIAGSLSTLYQPGYPENSPEATPAGAIPVYFKVENADWDYISKHDYIVYLTPVGIDGRFWPYKIPARITAVYIPPT